MNLQVDGKVGIVITEDNVFTSNCYDEYQITVDVPSGTRHVSIIPDGPGTFPSTSFTETISADKQYTIILDGNISSNEIQNTENSRITIVVRQTDAAGAVLETKIYRRTHSGNYC